MINWDIIHNFKKEEFICPCCGLEKMDLRFILLLDSLREICGFPIKITSGYRCKAHNFVIGGKETSSHLKGKACDIYCVDSVKRLAIINTALELGINRIGIGKDFIHLDTDEDKNSCIWVY